MKLSIRSRDFGGSGAVATYGKGGYAALTVGEHGGNVIAYGKDGKSQAQLIINDDGGQFVASGKGKGEAVIGINHFGNGFVSTWDKNGYRQ